MPFCNVKGHLLMCKRASFTLQKGTFYKPVCNLLIIYRLQSRFFLILVCFVVHGSLLFVRLFLKSYSSSSCGAEAPGVDCSSNTFCVRGEGVWICKNRCFTPYYLDRFLFCEVALEAPLLVVYARYSSISDRLLTKLLAKLLTVSSGA